MPLLQGQPFKLVSLPDIYPEDAEIFTIQHTGEKFLCKNDYEDRMALYSQNIWTCQSTGRSGLSHYEAWMSEIKSRLFAESNIPGALQKSILSLVHHSLSPLEQLVDASYILCHSQFHIGEIVTILSPERQEVTILDCIDAPPSESNSKATNGIDHDATLANNGVSNGATADDSPHSDVNHAKDSHDTKQREENGSRKEMLPKLYDVIVTKDKNIIKNVPVKNLLRPYKVPSKDHMRTFIRSSALRVRNPTCYPWVVAEDMVKKFDISNKLPSQFLQTKSQITSLSKRKSNESSENPLKKVKSDFGNTTTNDVSPTQGNNPKKESLTSAASPSMKNISPISSLAFTNCVSRSLNVHRPPGRPPGSKSSKPPKLIVPKIPKKRGRPSLTPEEKERNKKMRQASLLDFTSKMAEVGANNINVFKVKCHNDSPQIFKTDPATFAHPLMNSAYKSPVKRANCAESIMNLPFMRRFKHENKTIKGVLGQFRRYAHTMDVVLTKLTPEQIDLIPDESMREDLLTRQNKLQFKKFIEKLTPEERKQHQRDKARFIALERWKERKLKNLKVEDQTIPDLLPIPEPTKVDTTEGIPNCVFGEVVMVTDFVKCFKELLMGEEKFSIDTRQLMEAISAGSGGYRVVADIMCCILPTIVHDHISKNCKELGIKISVIPINYQTAPELARLCLAWQEEEDATSTAGEEYLEVGREEHELSEELLSKLECCDLWELSPMEVLKVLVALVHKSLCTAAISIYVDEVDEKVLQALRERRKFLKQFHKAALDKRKEEKIRKKMSKDVAPKRARGRPKGYSPKLGRNINEVLCPKPKPIAESPLTVAVQNRRVSFENSRKEREEMIKAEREKQRQLGEDIKRKAMERRYEDLVFKRDNILRRTPVGMDRHHNRYWVFHATTPGLYVEKGWVDKASDYNCEEIKCEKLDSAVEIDDVKPVLSSCGSDLLSGPSSNPDDPGSKDHDSPLPPPPSSESKPKIGHSLSKVSISPMKVNGRGRPPKEAYMFVDEENQTFPTIQENFWYYYENMDDVIKLIGSLSDKGQRESQLAINLNLNKDRLLYHYSKKFESAKAGEESSNRVKESVKEEIIQIEREVIEGWLGGVDDFAKWEENAAEVTGVESLGQLLIHVQQSVQIKNLKGIMAPVKEVNVIDSNESTSETVEKENPAVSRWKDAVRACKTYSRLHVLVGMFDSCIRWEKSMATRKCKVCRNKNKDDPLAMCGKCETSYHYYCLRPALKEDPGESWSCPACVPRKTRREEVAILEQDTGFLDEDEREDPTFSLTGLPKRKYNKRRGKLTEAWRAKHDRECAVCRGRIGLIACSQCDNSYHSECHDPPLLTRARKDWICGDCSNSGKGTSRKSLLEMRRPVTRNTFFEVLDEASMAPRRGNRSGARDKFGRWLKEVREREESDEDDDEAPPTSRVERPPKGGANRKTFPRKRGRPSKKRGGRGRKPHKNAIDRVTSEEEEEAEDEEIEVDEEDDIIEVAEEEAAESDNISDDDDDDNDGESDRENGDDNDGESGRENDPDENDDNDRSSDDAENDSDNDDESIESGGSSTEGEGVSEEEP